MSHGPVPKLGWAIAIVALAAAIGGYAFLGGDDGPDRADASDAEMVAVGKKLYAKHCAECHGADLQGQPNWRRRLADGTLPAPPHDASGHTWHHPDRVLFRYTKQGGAALAPPDFKSNMPGFGDTLSDTQIWSILAYIKSRWPADIRAAQERRNRAESSR
jgi:mono/diheme cytochrome c family protein